MGLLDPKVLFVLFRAEMPTKQVMWVEFETPCHFKWFMWVPFCLLSLSKQMRHAAIFLRAQNRGLARGPKLAAAHRRRYCFAKVSCDACSKVIKVVFSQALQCDFFGGQFCKQRKFCKQLSGVRITSLCHTSN